MAPTTRLPIQQDINAAHAVHWKVHGTIPEEPKKATIPVRDAAVPLALNIPTLEPIQTNSADGTRDTGNIATLTTYPSKVTHLLLPALLTDGTNAPQTPFNNKIFKISLKNEKTWFKRLIIH